MNDTQRNGASGINGAQPHNGGPGGEDRGVADSITRKNPNNAIRQPLKLMAC